MNSDIQVKQLWQILQMCESTKWFFSVSFFKKNGELRKLQGQMGVIKFLNGNGARWNPREHNMVFVYDHQKKDYRTVNLRTVTEFKCGDIHWTNHQEAYLSELAPQDS